MRRSGADFDYNFFVMASMRVAGSPPSNAAVFNPLVMILDYRTPIVCSPASGHPSAFMTSARNGEFQSWPFV